MIESDRQAIVDDEHLRLLRLGYFVSAGTAAFFASFGLLYAAMGLAFGLMSKHFPTPPGAPAHVGPPPEIGWIFGIFGVAFASVGITIAALRLREAKCVRLRRSRVFCLIMAATCCLEIPYGTAFGVLAFSTLSRESVRKLFRDATS